MLLTCQCAKLNVTGDKATKITAVVGTLMAAPVKGGTVRRPNCVKTNARANKTAEPNAIMIRTESMALNQTAL